MFATNLEEGMRDQNKSLRFVSSFSPTISMIRAMISNRKDGRHCGMLNVEQRGN
jgi:hypothetical protein